jgi:hypothetical protein
VWGQVVAGRRKQRPVGTSIKWDLKTNEGGDHLLIIFTGLRNHASGSDANHVAVGPLVFHVLQAGLRPIRNPETEILSCAWPTRATSGASVLIGVIHAAAQKYRYLGADASGQLVGSPNPTNQPSAFSIKLALPVATLLKRFPPPLLLKWELLESPKRQTEHYISDRLPVFEEEKSYLALTEPTAV